MSHKPALLDDATVEDLATVVCLSCLNLEESQFQEKEYRARRVSPAVSFHVLIVSRHPYETRRTFFGLLKPRFTVKYSIYIMLIFLYERTLGIMRIYKRHVSIFETLNDEACVC